MSVTWNGPKVLNMVFQVPVVKPKTLDCSHSVKNRCTCVLEKLVGFFKEIFCYR